MKRHLLDTNVYIGNPNAIFEYKEVIVPKTVIDELIKFEDERSARGKSARRALRVLDIAFSMGDLLSGVFFKETLIKVVFNEKESNPDISILNSAIENECILVTNDVSLRLRAKISGIESCSYTFQKLDKNHKNIHVAQSDLDKMFLGESSIHVGVNEYATLVAEKGPVLCRGNELGIAKPIMSKPMSGILPKNREQKFSFDALSDKDVKLVALEGRAGTGKTLMAISAGIESVLRGDHDGLIICRSTVPVGRDIGYLPGDTSEKMAPWLGAVDDNLDIISGALGKNVHEMFTEGKIKIEPLSFMRGRSFQNKFILIDECQNMSDHEVKTVITRAGENTKIVLTGDSSQIDAHWLDETNNGLSHVISRMRGQSIFCNVFLSKTERSFLSEVSSRLL